MRLARARTLTQHNTTNVHARTHVRTTTTTITAHVTRYTDDDRTRQRNANDWLNAVCVSAAPPPPLSRVRTYAFDSLAVRRRRWWRRAPLPAGRSVRRLRRRGRVLDNGDHGHASCRAESGWSCCWLLLLTAALLTAAAPDDVFPRIGNSCRRCPTHRFQKSRPSQFRRRHCCSAVVTIFRNDNIIIVIIMINLINIT